MAKFTDLCNRLLQDKGMSASKMMKDIGFSSGLYSQWRKGSQNPSAAKVAAIAHYLNVPVSYFYDSPSEPSIIPLDNTPASIPVFESVSAGFGAYADNKIIGYTSVYLRNVDMNEIIAAKVVGDSMYPHICDGDTVIIRKNAEINDGDIVVVLIDGDEAVVKKIKFGKDSLTLVSFNPEYKDRTFVAADADRIKIMGKVISSQKSW